MEEEDVKSWCFYDEFDPMPATWTFMKYIDVIRLAKCYVQPYVCSFMFVLKTRCSYIICSNRRTPDMISD
jgi:hypothetical protein